MDKASRYQTQTLPGSQLYSAKPSSDVVLGRLLVGLEKIFSVEPISMSLPGFPWAARLKNAVWSLTRAACCMLW